MSRKKFLILLTILLLIYPTLWAVEEKDTVSFSGFYKATSKTIPDEYCYLTDLLSWKKIDFNDFYVYTGFDRDTYSQGNAAAAFHVLENTLSVKWEGNLWTSNPTNIINILFGTNNMAFSANFNQQNKDEYSFGVGYGMTFLEKFGAYGTFDIGFAKNEVFQNNILGIQQETLPKFMIGFKYTLNDSDTISDSLKVTFEGSYKLIKITEKNTGRELIKPQTTIHYILTPEYSFNYKISNTLIYGLKTEIPIEFESESSTINFIISNGFSAKLIPNILSIQGGLETTLPHITYSKDGSANGTLTNKLYSGCSLQLSPEAKLDFCSELNIGTGISMQDIWQNKWALNISIKK